MGGNRGHGTVAFRTVKNAIEAELLPKIKGSRFIGCVGHISSREEALELVSTRRMKYPQANHHCFAYSLAASRESFCSDDGEPHNTAGRPILHALQQYQVHDVCLIVSRIFGGTKLGTGGLVRAYGGAAEFTLSQAIIEETQISTSLLVRVPIRWTENVKKYLQVHQGDLIDLEFSMGDAADLSIQLPLVQVESFTTYINELSGGRAIVTKL